MSKGSVRDLLLVSFGSRASGRGPRASAALDAEIRRLGFVMWCGSKSHQSRDELLNL